MSNKGLSRRIIQYLPLNDEEQLRVTEINFTRLITQLVEQVGDFQLATPILTSVAYTLQVMPHFLLDLSERAYRNPPTPSKEELIELFYRSGYPRKEVARLSKVSAGRISEIMRDDVPYIQPCTFNETELKFMKQTLNFFEGITEVLL